MKVALQQFLPGFFLLPRNFVAAVHADGSVVSPDASPAKPGETIAIYGTGFGPTEPRVNSGEVFTGAAPLAAGVAVRIGSAVAPVGFAGLTGAGLYQLNVTVPNLPDGDHDVVATVGGVRTQPLARLRIQR